MSEVNQVYYDRAYEEFGMKLKPEGVNTKEKALDLFLQGFLPMARVQNPPGALLEVLFEYEGKYYQERVNI